MCHLAPPISALRLSQVQLYILSDESAEVGLVQLLSLRPLSRKYGFFASRAMVSSAATPAAVCVYSPQTTITTSMLSIRRRTFSFQSPVSGSLSERSLISNGESGCFAWPARRFRRSGEAPEIG